MKLHKLGLVTILLKAGSEKRNSKKIAIKCVKSVQGSILYFIAQHLFADIMGADR